MTENQLHAVRVAGFLLAVTVAATLQHWSPHRRLTGSRRVNLGLWAVNLLVIGTVCGACACTVARWAAANEVGLLNVISTPFWANAVTTILALDFVSYAWHRANHRVPVLWRFHRVHHSDMQFTVSTGVRFHPGELVLSLPLRLAAVAALGAPPAAVVIFEIAFSVANLIEHGDINLPVRLETTLARVCITPALHRRHHSRQVSDLQTNFGTIFAVWDRLLGTFGESTSAVEVRTGLPEMAAPATLLQAVALPFVPERF